MMYASAGKLEQAASELTKSLVLAGQYDHELTSMALLELGKIAFVQGQLQMAASYFLEATFPAAAFDQYDVMQEAFQWGLVTHLVSGQAGLYPPLVPASAWSRRHSRALQAWLGMLAAENCTAAGDTAQAFGLLGETRQAVGMRDLRDGVFGTRFNYVSAMVEFQRRNLAAGSTQLGQAIAFLKGSSKRLFQIDLADAAFVSGAVTQRVADDLYSNVLREPTAADWAVEPMDTLAGVLTPHPLPLQHWLEATMARKDAEKSLEIADRIKRHRFFCSLPLGGRDLSLRWILEAPESLLPQSASLQRRDLLARYRNYAQLSTQAAGMRGELDKLPLVPANPDEVKKQTQLLEQLAKPARRRNSSCKTSPCGASRPISCSRRWHRQGDPEGTLGRAVGAGLHYGGTLHPGICDDQRQVLGVANRITRNGVQAAGRSAQANGLSGPQVRTGRRWAEG